MSGLAEEERAAEASPFAAPQATSSATDDGATPSSPIFYGWIMVVVAAVAMVATFPGRTQGLGTVTERILEDPKFGFDHEEWGQLNMAATLIGAIFCLGFGRLIDRFGMRTILPLTLAALGAATVGMAFAPSVTAFFLLLVLTRGFGQSALSVASISIPGKWFLARLSWATALYSILMTVGFIVAFMIARECAGANWRWMWGGVGLIVMVLAPFAWLFARSGPESIGTTVDGRPAATDDVKTPNEPATGVGLLRAMATLDFWVFAGATSLFATISSGISLFNESILVELGFRKELYYDSMMVAIAFGLLGNFATGWAAMKFSMGTLTAIGLAGLAVALFALTQLTQVWHVYLYAIGYAFAGGMVTVVFFAVWAKRFGRRRLGSIQGIAQMTTVLASAVGQALFGFVHDRSGSYEPALLGLGIAAAALAVVACFVPERTFADELSADGPSLSSPAPTGQD